MFWDKWIPEKYLIKSEICAVEVCFTDDGIIYYYTVLKNKNNKLEISDSGFSNDNLKLPLAISKNKIPVFIVINGKGIILKKVTLNENSEPAMEEIIRQNLPAINSDDFYIQLYKQKDFSGFLVLCRKSQLDTIVAELKKEKLDIADILLGAPAIIGLEPLWTNHNSIKTSLQKVMLTNGSLDEIHNTPSDEHEDIKIEGLSFSSQHTLGFSGGLTYLMKQHIVINNNIELVSYNERHIEKNKFRFLSLVAVAVAFLLAVTNVVFYTSYFDKNNKLETELGVYQGKYDQINQLLNDYQKNKNLIENAGVLNKNKLSEYGDRIGKTLPDEVILSELYFNPKKDTDESEDSLITFENKHLILKGNCSKSFIVNEWINVLKMQKFIKDVSLERFAYSNEGILPNFEIRLITE